MSSTYPLTQTNTSYHKRRPSQIQDVLWPLDKTISLHQRLFGSKHGRSIPVRQESTIPVHDTALNSYLVAPQYRRKAVAPQRTVQKPVIQQRGPAPVLQYSKLARPGFVTEPLVQPMSQTPSSPDTAWRYSVVDGLTFGWWSHRTKAWARVVIPVLVVLFLLAALVNDRHSTAPAHPTTLSSITLHTGQVADGSTSSNGEAAANTGQGSDNGNTNYAASAIPPSYSKTPISVTSTPSVASSPVTPTTPTTTIGGMGGGPGDAQLPAAPAAPDPAPSTSPQPLQPVSVPSQTLQIGDTQISTPSASLTL